MPKRSWILTVLGDSSHGFFSQVLQGVSDTLAAFASTGETTTSPVICSHDDKAWVEESILAMFREEPVVGLIWAASSAASPNLTMIQEYASRGVPVIQIDRRVVGLDSPWVGIDNAGAAAVATRHLIRHGHERIVLVGGRPQVTTNQLRFEGFSDAMRDAKVSTSPSVMWYCSDWETTKASIKGRLSAPDPPTALLCINGMATLGAMLAIREEGLNCPADVALIGWDDNPWCLLPDPSISMIRQPARQIGVRAADLLWQAIHGQPVGLDNYLPWDLLVRQSCGCEGASNNGNSRGSI